MSRWVVDASPLIFLAKLNRLDLLRQSADEILVSPKVMKEVLARKDIAARRVEEASRAWLRKKRPGRRGGLKQLQEKVGPGEAEAIALARSTEADRVVMDDLGARREARRSGLRPVGTVGLLLAARLRGEVPSLKAEIEKLRDAGFHTSESLVEEVLRAAGEATEETAGDEPADPKPS